MTEEYKVKDYGKLIKRYFQTLDLKDEQGLIHEYAKLHSKEE